MGANGESTWCVMRCPPSPTSCILYVHFVGVLFAVLVCRIIEEALESALLHFPWPITLAAGYQ